MASMYHIQIDGFEQPKQFVEKWSSFYSYPVEEKYRNHISNALSDKESFLELFRWKNGTGDGISQQKTRTILKFWEKIDVLRELQGKFRWELFEREFEPHKTSTIWKIFLLHLIDPNSFPIFDQHVYRSYQFFHNGTIEELPNNKSLVYQIYKEEYREWFNHVHQESKLERKKMDESLFAYGKMLKKLGGYPISVRQG